MESDTSRDEKWEWAEKGEKNFQKSSALILLLYLTWATSWRLESFCLTYGDGFLLQKKVEIVSRLANRRNPPSLVAAMKVCKGKHLSLMEVDAVDNEEMDGWRNVIGLTWNRRNPFKR